MSVLISFDLPNELVDALFTLASETNRSRSDVATAAIAAYLRSSEPPVIHTTEVRAPRGPITIYPSDPTQPSGPRLPPRDVTIHLTPQLQAIAEFLTPEFIAYIHARAGYDAAWVDLPHGDAARALTATLHEEPA